MAMRLSSPLSSIYSKLAFLLSIDKREANVSYAEDE